MTETFFICDRCQGRWNVREPSCPQQVNIGLRLNYGQPYPLGSSYADERSKVWCRPCLVSAGVIVKAPPTNSFNVGPVPPPTYEEIFIQLLETLGFTRS